VICVILSGRWCNITVLNVHASCEGKSDDSFYKELQCVFDQFPRFDMKSLLDDFSAEIGREMFLN
jgi:hypothetical protein